MTKLCERHNESYLVCIYDPHTRSFKKSFYKYQSSIASHLVNELHLTIVNILQFILTCKKKNIMKANITPLKKENTLNLKLYFVI